MTAAAALLALLAPRNLAAEGFRCLAAGHDAWIPFSYLAADGAVEGAAHDILRRAVALAGGSYEPVHVGPWKRVFGSLHGGVIDLAAGVFVTAERRRDFDVGAAFGTETVVAVVQARSTLTFRTWNDLKGLKAIYPRGVSYGEEWDRFAAANLEHLEPPSPREGVMMLAAGRGDFGVSTRTNAEALMLSPEVGARFRILEPPLAELTVHALFRRGSDCARHRAAIDAALARMRESGEIAAMVQRHHPSQVRLRRDATDLPGAQPP